MTEPTSFLEGLGVLREGDLAADESRTRVTTTAVLDAVPGDSLDEHPRHADAPEQPAPAEHPVLQLTGVRKTYTTGSLAVEALRGVDLTVEQGEYVAVMGPSGSGKSTLMHILGCLDIPSSGQYLLDGEDVSTMDEQALAGVRNRRIGFVFQAFNLLPSLTAQRNVELPLVYAGVGKAERANRAREALAQVGLAERVDHRPGELSGGQQQRVSIARALVTNPALVLADEPTGNLDSTSTNDVLALFDDLHAQGRTIVLITHELDVAERSGRMVHMLDGVLGEGAYRPGAERRDVSTGGVR